MQFREAIVAWSYYWVVYIISGMAFTLLSKRIVSVPQDMKAVIELNFIVSLLVSLMVCYIPSIGFVSRSSIVVRYAICMIIADVWFYHTHRIMHHPLIFKRVHSKHHSLREPFALYALYSSPVEMFLSNTPSASVGPALCGVHGADLLFLMILVSLSTTSSHSGIAFLSDSHDLHHRNYKVNFGVMGFFDKLYGTST